MKFVIATTWIRWKWCWKWTKEEWDNWWETGGSIAPVRLEQIYNEWIYENGASGSDLPGFYEENNDNYDQSDDDNDSYFETIDDIDNILDGLSLTCQI